MAKFSMKQGGKEVGDAKVYAPPHTMSSGSVSNKVPTKTGAQVMNEMNMSVGGISKGNYPEAKTTGIKMRGTGAATKGVMSRGPMG
jgi:hypothetical protein